MAPRYECVCALHWYECVSVMVDCSLLHKACCVISSLRNRDLKGCTNFTCTAGTIESPGLI